MKPIAVTSRAAALPGSPGRLRVGSGLALQLPEVGPSAHAPGPVSWLCQDCRLPLGHCRHRPAGALPAIALALLFPGLGQLAHRRFGPARTARLAAIAASAEALPPLIPQWTGRLPWNPSTWALALTAFLVVAVGALFDVVDFARRHRRRRRALAK